VPLNNQILKLNIDPSGMECELKGTVVRERMEMEWGWENGFEMGSVPFWRFRNLFVTALKAYFIYYILFLFFKPILLFSASTTPFVPDPLPLFCFIITYPTPPVSLSLILSLSLNPFHFFSSFRVNNGFCHFPLPGEISRE